MRFSKYTCTLPHHLLVYSSNGILCFDCLLLNVCTMYMYVPVHVHLKLFLAICCSADTTSMCPPGVHSSCQYSQATNPGENILLVFLHMACHWPWCVCVCVCVCLIGVSLSEPHTLTSCISGGGKGGNRPPGN